MSKNNMDSMLYFLAITSSILMFKPCSFSVVCIIFGFETCAKNCEQLLNLKEYSRRITKRV